MRAVIQRVGEARVEVGGVVEGEIGRGLFVLLGVQGEDSEEDADWLAGKIARMRIFSDEKGQMNLGLGDVEGRVLVVSQFTLHASTRKGNRPSFLNAARPEKAVPLYEKFLGSLEKESGRSPETGKFGAEMQIFLVNDGPVTILMDSKNRE